MLTPTPATRTYLVRFWSAMALYLALVGLQSYLFAHAGLSGLPRIAVSLLPVLPVAFIAYAVVENLRRLDELERKVQFEAMAIAFGITSVLSIAYGFLENGAGAPPINLVWVWAVLGLSWLVCYLIVRRWYR